MMTPGSSTGLHLLLTAILNPQDKVLMTDPAYPCNRQFVTLLQGQVIQVPVGVDTQFQLTPKLLKASWQEGIKLVMLATPSNPTGSIIEADDLLEMAQFLAEKQAYLLVDEIYQGLVYDRPAESILSQPNLPNNVLVINSFSKFFGMTGWRLGWIVAPDYLMPTLDKLGQNLFLAAPTPSQYAALRVLDADSLQALEARRQIFEQRRNHLYRLMTEAGFNLPIQPQGAFYLYWDVSSLTQNAEEFALRLLHEQGVAVTPGKDFGQHQAHQMIRLAYTQDISVLTEAVNRFKLMGAHS
jgi:aspartate/methionine/tyrosine aminotransferase